MHAVVLLMPQAGSILIHVTTSDDGPTQQRTCLDEPGALATAKMLMRCIYGC